MSKWYLVMVVFGIIMLPQLANSQSQQEPCIISETYSETLSEYDHDLLRIAIWTNQPSSPLSEVDTLRLNFQLLMSMRHHLEDTATSLPTCSQAYNQAYITLISSYQDVLGLLLSYHADVDRSVITLNRITSAQDRARAKQIDLNNIKVHTNLQSS